jgi:acyl-CoA thioester hydrolase
MKKRIFYHDTDCGGVVYYANYLKFMEEARTEFLEERGVFLKDMSAAGTLFVVAHQEIYYKSPARYGDTLEIASEILCISTVRLEYRHKVTNQDGKLVCTGKAVLVCVDKDIRPKAIPDELRNKLS